MNIEVSVAAFLLSILKVSISHVMLEVCHSVHRFCPDFLPSF